MSYIGKTTVSPRVADYTVEQMAGRHDALCLAAKLLSEHLDPPSESQAIIGELRAEAKKWRDRADRYSDPLSPSQRKTYDHLVAYMKEYDKSPTMVELGKLVGICSSGIKFNIQAMEKKGVLHRALNSHRGIKVLQQV